MSTTYVTSYSFIQPSELDKQSMNEIVQGTTWRSEATAAPRHRATAIFRTI